jgi:hypothetical protein
MTNSDGYPCAIGNLAADESCEIPSHVFLIPAMIERRKSKNINSFVIDRDLFIAIFIPIGD